MKTPFYARMNMYHAVIQQLEKEPAVINAVPALKKNFALFAAKADAISSLMPAQAQSSKGESGTKEAKKLELINQTITTASSLAAWANDTGNAEITEATRFTEAGLSHMKESMLPPLAQSIYDLAVAHKTSLGDWGITDEGLQALADAIPAFKNKAATPRNKITNRKVYTQTISQLFAEADKLLNGSIKKLMRSIKNKFPAVYDQFGFNCKVVGAPSATTAAKRAKLRKAATKTEGNNGRPEP